MSEKITRKEFLKKLSMFGIVSVGAGTFMASCGGKKTQEEQQPATEQAAPPADTSSMQEASDPCTDLTGLTDAEIKMRETLQYVGKSPYPDKRCDNCQFWIPAAEGEVCGGCKILKGPINAAGHCTSWAAKQA